MSGFYRRGTTNKVAVAVLALAIEVEHLAAVYCRILTIGEPELLTVAEMVKVIEKFATYGVQDS